jgi:hypothetical protein
MKRLLSGTIVGGLLLSACGLAWPGLPGYDACFLSAFLATVLLLQLGPRSLVEKVLFLLTVVLFTWQVDSGNRSLGPMLVSWTLAGSALAWVVHPRAE